MKESPQEQLLRTFKEQLGGFYTPAALLARLGIRLMTPLRRPNDLLDLTDEQAEEAVRLLPNLQHPVLDASVVARTIS